MHYAPSASQFILDSASFTNGDFTNTKALHSCMHRHTTPHGYCWGSMNERAQVLNSVPSDNGRIAKAMGWQGLKWTKTPRTSGNTRHPFSSHHLCPPNTAFGWPIWTHLVRQTCGMLLVPTWATKSLQKNHGIQRGDPKTWVLSKGWFYQSTKMSFWRSLLGNWCKSLLKKVSFLTVISKMFVHLQSTHSRRQSHKGVATPFGTFANGRLEALEGLTLSVSIMSYNVYIGIPSLDSICRVMAKNWLVTGQCAHLPPIEQLKMFPALRVSSCCSQIHTQPDWLVTWHHAPPDTLRWCQSEGNWEGLHRAHRASYAKDFAAVTIFLTTALCVWHATRARDHEVMESEEVLFNHVQKS